MAFSDIFSPDLSVTVGNPTKGSEYNNLAINTDALKERYVISHYMSNTGVVGEDGFHKADYDDAMWMYAKDQGTPTNQFSGLILDSSKSNMPILRVSIGDTTAPPASPTGCNSLILGATGGLIAETSV